MRTFLLASALLVAPFAQGACTIVQASSLHDMPWQPDSDTVVLLDVDDTLICYPSHLGNELWFIEQWKRDDVDEFQRLAGFLADNLETVPVEPGAPDVVHGWQRSGAEVIAITSRALEHPAVEDWRAVTLNQIQSAGFTIQDSALYFSAATPKGEAIASLIASMPVPPRRVLFIDDRLSDVEGVEEALGDQTELLSVWYRACEPRRAAYDSDLAREELAFLLEQAQLLTGRSVVDQGQ